MPILEVRALAPPPAVEIPVVLERLCRDVAGALACDLEGVWATWETIPAGHYVEGDCPATRQPADTHPPMIRVLIAEGWQPALVRTMLSTAAQTLGEALGIEADNVFVHVEKMPAGTVYAGGKMLE